jgi:hypothetical protein
VSRLDDLDRRLVPLLAARLRAAVDRTTARRDATVAGWRAFRAALLDPRTWRRLDDRFATKGPLGLMREVPQLGFLLVAAVFMSGAGVALARSGPERAETSNGSPVDAAGTAVIGPETGLPVVDYLAATRARVVDLNRADPDREFTALVSFVAYAKVESIAELVAEVDVAQVLVRAKAAGPTAEVVPISVTDMVADTKRVYAGLAQRKAQDQKDNLSQARSIATSTSPTDRAFREEFLLAAEVNGKEAAAYRTSCKCVFAVLVVGKARDLAELLATEGVRTVDVAQAGAEPQEVSIRQYFLPEDSGVVPDRPPLPGYSGGS